MRINLNSAITDRLESVHKLENDKNSETKEPILSFKTLVENTKKNNFKKAA